MVLRPVLGQTVCRGGEYLAGALPNIWEGRSQEAPVELPFVPTFHLGRLPWPGQPGPGLEQG